MRVLPVNLGVGRAGPAHPGDGEHPLLVPDLDPDLAGGVVHRRDDAHREVARAERPCRPGLGETPVQRLALGPLDPRHRAPEALAPVDVEQAAQHGLLGGSLRVEVHGRLDAQSLPQHPGIAVPLHDPAAHRLRIEGRHLPERVVDGVDPDRRIVGGPPHLLGDGAVLAHAPQHVAAPPAGRLGVEHRRVAAGRLRQPGEERGLGDGQLPGGLAEVVLRRRLDPVAVVPQVDAVQVQPEQLLLSEGLLQARRQDGLAGLAPEVLPRALGEALGGDQQRLGGLLGDGGAALDLLLEDVGVHAGAQRPQPVDAAVLEEVLVLGGQEGLHHVAGDPLVGDHPAPLLEELSDHLAVGAHDLRDHRGPVVRERLHRGQVAGEPEVPRHRGEQPGVDEGEQEEDRPAQRGAPPGAPRRHPVEHQLPRCRGGLVGHPGGL